jgi:hypothetical protein
MMQSGLVALFVTPSPKKKDGNGNRFVDDEPFINKRKPSSVTVAKGCFRQWCAYAYSSHSKDNSFCRMGFGQVCFERWATTSHG